MKFFRLIGIALIAAASNVYAVGEGGYFGLQLGQSKLHNNQTQIQSGSGAVTTSSPDNTGFGGRIFGGYQVGRYFAMEMGFTYYSPTTYDNPPTTTCGKPYVRENAVDIVGKVLYPLFNTGLEVFVKGGVAGAYQQVAGSLDLSEGASCGNRSTTVKVLPTAAIGASYDVTQNWVVDVSYSRVFKTKGSGYQNADLFALGASYHFVAKYCGQFLC